MVVVEPNAALKLLPETGEGYSDVRLENIRTSSFRVTDHQVLDSINSHRHGQFVRVAGDQTFHSGDHAVAKPQKTPFSRYVRSHFQDEASLPSAEEHRDFDGIPEALREVALSHAEPGISFRFLWEDRWVRWANCLGMSRLRIDRTRLIRVDAQVHSQESYVHLRRFLHQPTAEQLEKELLDLKATCTFLGNARRVRVSSCRVVLHPSVAAVLVHEIFGHFAEAERFPEHFSRAIGTKVGGDDLNVMDVPSDPKADTCMTFDDEGVTSRPITVIRNGTLSSGLHTLTSAYRNGVAPNGRARARDFRYPVQTRMTNIQLQSGVHSVEQLFNDVCDGYYLWGSLGGEATGDTFQVACQYGYRIRNGTLAEPLNGPVLYGKRRDVSNGIVGIGSDSDWVSDGGCFADDQFLAVSGRGAPHLAVRGVDLA